LTICSPEISKLESSKCTAKGATVENWRKNENLEPVRVLW
jgi:hypothetical protein